MNAFELVGAGQNAAMNVLKFTFNWDLAAAPKLKAWDDHGMDSTNHRIFAGTTGNGSKSMIGAIGCTIAPAAAWWVNSLVEGATVNNASLLKGDDGFVLLSSGALGYESDESSGFEESSGTGGGTVYANIDFYFPYDLTVSDTFSFVLALEYEYTGDAPVVHAYGNTGTEAVPSWIELTMEDKDTPVSANVTEIKPCNTGEGGDGTGTYFMTRPPSGIEHPDKIWVRDYPG